jgi:hypothetical protein
MKKYYLVVLLIIIPLVKIPAQNDCNNNYAILTLTLGDGFLPNENIKIVVERSSGKDSIIFNGHLKRVSDNAVNGYGVPLEKGRINTVILTCIDRNVKYKHSFLFNSETFFEIDISSNNEFQFISSDQPFTYE